MIVAGVNFVLLYRAIRPPPTTAFVRDEEFRLYVVLVGRSRRIHSRRSSGYTGSLTARMR